GPTDAAVVIGDELPTPVAASEGDIAPITFGYDAYAETFWYTAPGADGYNITGVAIMTSGNALQASAHVLPPAEVTESITWGWYLGRHDMVVMRDPSDPGLFYIGYPGITRDSEHWERIRPDPIYDYPFSAQYLDEYNGILHTVHDQ